MDYVEPVLFALVFRIPVLAVWAVGLGLALTRRREYPGSYQPFAAACCIFMIVSVASTVTSVVMPIRMMVNGATALEVGRAMTIVSVVTTVCDVGAWVLVLIAVFARRGRAAAFAPPISG